MAESLGDKPSSRVLRPPGGGSSNIFGGSDETSSGNRMNTKPTFQSSVFGAEPESARPQSTNRPGNQCSDIFGTGSGNNDKPRVSDAKKVSKTHQSSIFQEPEPMSEEKRRAIAEHRISNIPMFSDGPEKVERPSRRPITAPTRMPYSFDVSSDTNYATDVNTAPGERTKTRTGYKPANDNLQSTVFNLKNEPKRMQCRHFPEVKSTLLDIPVKPRIRMRPVHRNEISSLFLSESDVNKIKSECQKRPMSASLNGLVSGELSKETQIGDGAAEQNFERKPATDTYQRVFPSQDVEDWATEQVAERKPGNNTYQSKVFRGQDEFDDDECAVFTADDRMSCLTRTRPPTRREESATEDEAASPIWSASDHGVVRCTRRGQCSSSRRMQESSLFKGDDCDFTPALWSSDFNMASFAASSVNFNNTFKSSVFDHACNTEAASPAMPDFTESRKSPRSRKETEMVSNEVPNGLIVKTITDALRDVAIDSTASRTNRTK